MGDVQARAGRDNAWISLSRFLLHPSDGLLVCHRNGDRQDCRRENLELLTRRELSVRALSLGRSSKNSSGRTGVQQLPSGKWIASLTRDGRPYSGGSHDTMAEAVAARDELEQLLLVPELDEEVIDRFRTRQPLPPENEIERNADIVIILLKDGDGRVRNKAQIDASDWDRVRMYLWRQTGDNHRVMAITGEKKSIGLARLLMDPPRDTFVYHLNGDLFDCRRSNLAVGSRHDQMVNALTRRRPNNSSGRVGVHWIRSRRLWQAYLTCHGIRYSGGCHDTFEDAVEARRELERMHFGRILDPAD